MTRFLASALGAAEPGFSQTIAQLERAAGRPSADIRLTEEIKHRTRAKIAELGLDPDDTTGEELFAALQQRLKSDEVQIRSALNISSSDSAAAVISKVQRYLRSYGSKTQCFALKSSVAKRLLKKKPPKLAMKRLGYRSLDSMLKHEPVAYIYAAALISESGNWHRAFLEQYTKLGPSDFEQRSAQIVTPSSKHWGQLARAFVAKSHHNIVSFKDIGTVVLLPIESDMSGLATTELLMALDELNSLRAHSSFVKLQQVKPNFGEIIRDVSVGEAYMTAKLAGQQVSWRTIQRYYSSHPQAYHPEIFEPHIEPDDLAWQDPEDVLSGLSPSLRFWQQTQSLGLIDRGKPVSMNMFDAAVSLCNNSSFSERAVHFLRNNVWHELILRYLNQDNLEAALREQLADNLAESESAFALEDTNYA